jgi:hypothetical protein
MIAGQQVLWATHPDYALAFREFDVAPGELTTVDLVLSAGVSVNGHAWLGDTPMAGLEIVATTPQSVQSKSVLTASDGSYRIDGVAGNPVTLVAAGREWSGAGPGHRIPNAQQTVEAPDSGELVVDFAFPAVLSTVSGTVLVHGMPPAEGYVRFEITSGDAVASTGSQVNEAGEYRAKDVLPGNADVTATVVDSDGVSRTKLLDASVPEGRELLLDIDFEGTSVIHGRVEGMAADEMGQVRLLAGTWAVDLPDFEAILNLDRLQLQECDIENGAYRFEHVEAGEYTVVAFAARIVDEADEPLQNMRYTSESIAIGEASERMVNLSVEH